MKPFYHLVLSLTLLGSSTLSLQTAFAETKTQAPEKKVSKSVKDEQKQLVKIPEKGSCPEGKAYCCNGQNAEGFDNCSCFSTAECAEAENN